ncbi:MAG: dihydroorotase [Candidatus Anammoximicrobium sp.]|nr:dihydroorotase [Candidatus Anammoximicrobium sp.]
MSRILIENGRVIDPSQQLDRVMNLLVENGRIAGYDAVATGYERVLSAAGKIVSPGLIDLHVQLREPGREEDETIESGTAAAVAGGFTSLVCLPNTEPPIDSQASVEFIRQKAARAGNCHVYVAGCVSKDRAGKELAEIGSLVEAGAVAFTDAPRGIQNAELLRRAFEYCLMFDKPILNHPEVLELSHDGVMHEGAVSMLLGLEGMPTEAEDVMTSRDLRLAESTGGRLHLLNVSSQTSVDLVRRVKSRGVGVSAGVCMYNLVLTDERLRTFDSNYKVDPPLRSQEHVEACLQGLKDGTLDVISCAHAPRASEKKMLELDQAPFGMVGLETLLGLVATHVVRPGHLDWMQALEKLTVNPARVLGIPKGTLQIGADADITIIDPDATWTVDPTQFRSKSSNTPFGGWTLQGRAVQVLVGGEPRL